MKSLSITHADLLRHVGHYLGYSRQPSEWEERERSDVEDILARGLRRAYGPICLPGESSPHTFTFTTPWYTLGLVGGQADYDLPPDFGGIESEITYKTSSTGFCSIRLISETEMRRWRQRDANTVSGYPEWACVLPMPSDGSQEQGWQLAVHPIPVSNFDVTLKYRVNPLAVADDAPYPLGGQPHAEMLLASVLAAAELHQNGEQGPKYADYLEQLKASVALDRKLNVETLGYCGDGGSRDPSWNSHMPLFFNGVEI